MMLEKVWLVFGSRTPEDGEGDQFWIVAVYPNEETAKQHRDKCREYALSAASMEENWDHDLGDFDEWQETHGPYDVLTENWEFAEDVHYQVLHAPFVLHLDQYQERHER